MSGSEDGEETEEDAGELAAARLVENERIKLIATLLNTLASGSVLAGIVIPLASALAGTMPAGIQPSIGRLLLATMVWLSTGFVLHYWATQVLGKLKP